MKVPGVILAFMFAFFLSADDGALYFLMPVEIFCPRLTSFVSSCLIKTCARKNLRLMSFIRKFKCFAAEKLLPFQGTRNYESFH